MLRWSAFRPAAAFMRREGVYRQERYNRFIVTGAQIARNPSDCVCSVQNLFPVQGGVPLLPPVAGESGRSPGYNLHLVNFGGTGAGKGIGAPTDVAGDVLDRIVVDLYEELYQIPAVARPLSVAVRGFRSGALLIGYCPVSGRVVRLGRRE